MAKGPFPWRLFWLLVLASLAARRSRLPLDELIKLDYVSSDEATALHRHNIRDLGDLFSFGAGKPDVPEVVDQARSRVLDAVVKATGVAAMHG